MKVKGKFAVVIPALNEEHTISRVVSDALDSGAALVVVVDDGSSDSTGQRAQQAGAEVIKHMSPRSAWIAMQTGLRFCYRQGFKQVITMDADGQHTKGALENLIGYSGNADLVIASCVQRGSKMRHIAWRYFRFITQLKIKDITSGMRLYSASAIKVVCSKQATMLDFQDVGLLLMIRDSGLEIEEIQVTMAERCNGTSRIFSSWWKVSTYMLITTVLCVTKTLPTSSTKYIKGLKIDD